MAVQIMKSSYSGSVDFNARVVRLPDPEPRAVRLINLPSRADAVRLIAVGLPTVMLSMVSVPAIASTVPISDGTSTLTVDTTKGLTGLTIDGVQQLSLAEFFYRAGSGSIVPLTPTTEVGTPTAGIARFNYADTNVSAQITYELSSGSNPGYPVSIDETVKLTNLTGSALGIQLFKYTDFNLDNETNGQTASIEPVTPPDRPDTIDQSDSTQVVTSNSVGQQNAVTPDHYEITKTGALLTSLQNSTLITLNDTQPTTAGNINFAFEFDNLLDPNGTNTGQGDTLTASVQTTISAVPEPTGLAVMASSAGLLLSRRRRSPAIAVA